jgi:glycosyltransferase involved in cell wall biosynthesis
MEDTNIPKVTVGIPIYCGETYLEETLINILNQTFKDFEIVITDNNPGGTAEEVATRYANEYNNIKYIKHTKNIGALQNWNSIIQYASGEYFMYAGGHDLLSDDFIEKALKKIEKYPSAVLIYAPTQFISSEGDLMDREIGLIDTSGASLVRRFVQVLWANQEPLYGLMRLDCIKRTRMQKEIVGSGAVWLAEMSIFGDFKVCTDIKRYRRANRKNETKEQQLRRYHTSLFSHKRIRICPHWRFVCQFYAACFIGRISIITRLRLLFAVILSALIRYFPNMLFDIASVIKRFPKGKLY